MLAGSFDDEEIESPTIEELIKIDPEYSLWQKRDRAKSK